MPGAPQKPGYCQTCQKLFLPVSGLPTVSACPTCGRPTFTITLAPSDLRLGEARPDAPTVPEPLEGTITPPTAGADIQWGPRVPRRLGPYDLLEELGHGGMGAVYRARHAVLGTLRAVKVLIAGEHASPEAIARFQREAAAVARMGKHPNIVTVHDLGEDHGIAYYAMELVEGKTLRAHLKEKVYAPQEVAQLAAKSARALHFAHEHGIVHRDVKPDNIVVRDDGEPQVMDFGLARDADSNVKLSISGAAMGTPNYMAPEQVEGLHQQCDARTDVYALGATLYEVLTGTHAHPGHALPQVFLHIRRGDVIPLRRHRADVPRDLETICLKCLAPEPAKRYPTALALAEDLERFLSGEPIAARRVGLAERTWKRMRRNRAVSLLVAALVLTLLGALLWRPVGEWNARRQAARAREERYTVARGRVDRAQEALARGAQEDARTLARGVVEEFEGTADARSPLPLPEAHAVLASVARRQGDRQGALLEAFRAARVALGTRWEEACRLDLACQVCEVGEFEHAEALFAARRVPEGLVFDRAEAEARRRLAALLSPREEIPILPRAFRVGNIDGEGTDEIVLIGQDGDEVQVLSYSQGEFVKSASAPIPRTLRLSARGLDVLDLDGQAPAEVLIAGKREEAETGLVVIFRWNDGRLDLVAEGDLPSWTLDRPFASADLDHDGTRELLVGLGGGNWRGICVFSIDEAARKLVPRLPPVECGSDVWELVPREWEGRTEVLAFVGAWRSFEMWSISFDLQKGAMTVHARMPFAKEYRLERRLADDPAGTLVVGTSWTDDAAVPRRELMGKAAFDRIYPPPGIYVVPIDMSKATDLSPIARRDFPDVGDVEGRVCLLWDPKGRFCWSALTRRSGGRHVTGFRIHEVRGGDWEEVAGYEVAENWTMSPSSGDVDGDGDSELVVLLGNAFEVIGARRGGAASKASQVVGAAGPSCDWASRSLSTAVEAESLGLGDEAIRWYRLAVEQGGTLEEVGLAAQGLLRTGLAARRLAELAPVVRRTISRLPALRAPLARALLDAAEGAADWGLALDAADDLAVAPGLSRVERADLALRRRELDGILRPKAVVELTRRGQVLPLLATSPLCARFDADGALVFTCRASGRDGVFVPLDYDAQGYRLEGRVLLERLDWGANLDVGLVAGDPWAYSKEGWCDLATGPPLPRPGAEHLLELFAFGESWSPNRVLDLHVREARSGDSRRIRPRLALASQAPDGLPFVLEFAPHLDTLFARTDSETACLPDVHFADRRSYVRIAGHGDVDDGDGWGKARFTGLTLSSAGGTTRVVDPAPMSAVEMIFLANGRWIAGDAPGARRLYDAAIPAADLPTLRDAPWTEGAMRWAPVDARLWRGLLTAETDGVVAALPDLAEARRRSPERVRDLIRRAALPLADRPRATDALRALVAPRGNEEGWDIVGARLAQEWGTDVAAVLLADVGYRIVRRSRLKAPLGPARQGDGLISFDGMAVGDFGTYRRLRGAALDAGRYSVPIVLERDGTRIEARVDPRDGVFDLESVERLEPVRER